MNKKLLTIGTIGAIVAPIATVVSCGSDTSFIQSDQDVISKIAAPEAAQAAEMQWATKVLTEKYKDTKTPNINMDDFDKNTDNFKKDFSTALFQYISEHARKSANYFITLHTTLKSIGAPEPTPKDLDLLNKVTFTKESIDELTSYVTQEEFVKAWFFDVKKDSKDEDKVIYNPMVSGLKSTIIRMLVSNYYLSITKKQFEQTFPDTKITNEINQTTKDTTKFFPLINDSMEKRFSYSWTLSLDEEKSQPFKKVGQNEKSYSEAIAEFDATDKDSAGAKAPYSSTLKVKAATMPQSGTSISPNPNIDGTIISNGKLDTEIQKLMGYDAEASLPSGEGTLDTKSSSTIKSVTSLASRIGFIYTKDGVTKIVEKSSSDKIPLFSEDEKKVSLTMYAALMPTYNKTNNELEFQDINSRALGFWYFNKSEDIYAQAEKYFTSRKDENDDDTSVKLEISNPIIAKRFKEQGLSFIK